MYLYLSPNLPSVESLRDIKFQTPLRIYSADGPLIGEFGEIRRIPVSFADTPPLLIKAFLAAEDDRFYSHNGVDIRGLLRAVSRLLQTGERQGGGSTITMQVAKNSFPINDGSFIYKAKQILLALKIETELEKEAILEIYLNQNPFGNRAVGVGAAAQVYYGKSVAELTLAQLAMISGIPQAPSVQNPLVNPPRARKRRDWILNRMLSLGYISEADYQIAVSSPTTASYHGQQIDLSAPYVAEMVRKYMIDTYGEAAYSEGYRVYTTVDSSLQNAAQQAVINGLLAYSDRHGYHGPEQYFAPTSFDEASSADAASESEPDEDARPPQIYLVRAPTTDPEEVEKRKKFFGSDESDESEIIARLDLNPWLAELASIPSYGNLEPVIVVEAYQLTIRILFKDATVIELPWDNGPSEARAHISEDNRGPKPTAAENLFKPGDLIRVLRDDHDQWQLSQLPKAQAAIVAIDPNNGAIRALVGGFNFSYSNYNRATQAKRQPGSNFKPFIYAAALENGFTPATIVNDAPIIKYDSVLEKAWRPENSGGKFHGPMRLREGLYRSINNVAIKVLDSMGLTQTIRSMERFGFNRAELPRDLTLALGSHVLTPMQVARGYTVFANGGYKVEPYFIERIENSDGETIFQAEAPIVCPECELAIAAANADGASAENNSAALTATTATESGPSINTSTLLPLPTSNNQNPNEDLVAAELQQKLQEELNALLDTSSTQPKQPPLAERVMDARVAFLMDNMLKDVILRGTGTKARQLGRSDIAGKTGTVGSDINNFDAWFSGYNQALVATAWIGFDQNLPLGKGEFGASAALPIWMEFMQTALKDIPETVREQPPGMVNVRINQKTGLRALPNDPNYTFEFFLEESVPDVEESVDFLQPNTDSGETHPDEVF